MITDESYNTENLKDPAYWDFYYDARYCGPSRDAYIGMMLDKYRNYDPDIVPNSSPDNQETVEASLIVSKELMAKADREQEAVKREGLHPDYHRHSSGLITCGVINCDCDVIVSYDKYCDIGCYHNGLARVQDRKTKLFGFIDRHGNEVIPCTWRSAGDFSQHLADVQDEYEKYGYVDVTGEIVIPCEWNGAWPFHEGLARVLDYRRMTGMINQRGEEVIDCVWRDMSDFHEDLAGVKDIDGLYGFIDRTGEIVIPCRWKNVWAFSEGLAIVENFKERFGFINKKGELVIPCRWKKVNPFKNGVAKVSDSRTIFLKDKWVYIDKQGQIK